MPIKRRGFVRGLLLAPAAQAALSAQQAAPATAQAPARPAGRPMQSVPKLKVTDADLTAEIRLHFFTQEQFQTLQKLGAVMVPPMKGNPGATEAQAPEFLDFLLGVSPSDRQMLYRDGLDQLNAQARQKFQKTFGQLDKAQVDAMLKPLMVVRAWSQERPSDPLKDFVAQVHEDLRRATSNSREWAEAAAKSGRRFNRGFQTSGYYWKPIDPVVGD